MYFYFEFCKFLARELNMCVQKYNRRIVVALKQSLIFVYNNNTRIGPTRLQRPFLIKSISSQRVMVTILIANADIHTM